MKPPVFLSASVPTREPFASNFDAVAIREAILALVVVSLKERELVFGGHPAISPLVEHAARSLDATGRVHIYQSRYFENVIPEAARKFENLHWTDAVRGTESDLTKSLTAMREEMIGSREFCAAVVIGGMEGIFEEVTIFKTRHAGRPVIPVGSTGGAAAVVLDEMANLFSSDKLTQLREERRYRRLFREFLPVD